MLKLISCILSLEMMVALVSRGRLRLVSVPWAVFVGGSVALMHVSVKIRAVNPWRGQQVEQTKHLP